MDSQSSDRTRWEEVGQPLLELAAIGVIALVLTSIAVAVFPIWDDATVWRMITEDTAQISKNFSDRPVLGTIWQFLAERELLWKLAPIIHWLVWFGTGAVTWSLWRTLCPLRKRFALPVACLAMGPVLCEVQFVLLNPVFGSQLGPLLVYIALISALCLPRHLALPSHILLLTFIVFVVGFSVLLSEYAVVSTLIATSLILGRRQDPLPNRAVYATSLLGTAVIAYAVFWSMANPDMRPSVRPEGKFSKLTWRAKVTAVREASGVWQGAFGGFLKKVGQVRLDNKEERLWLTSIAVGLATALLVLLVSRVRTKDSTPVGSLEHGLVLMLIALSIGVAPIVFMGRAPTVSYGTRYWLPVLPLASCLTLSILLSITRPQLWWIVGCGCGFLLGYFTTIEGTRAISLRKDATKWGKQLIEYVPEQGIAVAIFESDWKSPIEDRDLSARLTYTWPIEKQRQFWAFTSLEEAWQEGLTGYSFMESSQHLAIHRSGRGYLRKGPVHKLLWVKVDPENSSLTIDVQWSAPSEPISMIEP